MEGVHIGALTSAMVEVFLQKEVMLVSLAAAISLATQLMTVEESMHGTTVMWTSVGIPLSLVTQPHLVEES